MTSLPKPLQESSLKSTLKWVGGKKRIVHEIVKYFPESYGTYHEPFVGGASVFLAVQPKFARLSDINSALVNYYVWLRDNPNLLMESAETLESNFNALPSIEDKKALFYKNRDEYNRASKNDVQAAALFLFLNKTSFNGLYRENVKGEFNVPFNNSAQLRLFEEENVLANSLAMQGANLTHGTFEAITELAADGDLVYFDPPYIPLSTTSAFTSYTKSPFGPAAQLRLRDTARELVSRGVHVVLSNSYSPDVELLYEGFELQKVEINRLVSAKGTSRGLIHEYIIIGRP